MHVFSKYSLMPDVILSAVNIALISGAVLNERNTVLKKKKSCTSTFHIEI